MNSRSAAADYWTYLGLNFLVSEGGHDNSQAETGTIQTPDTCSIVTTAHPCPLPEDIRTRSSVPSVLSSPHHCEQSSTGVSQGRTHRRSEFQLIAFFSQFQMKSGGHSNQTERERDVLWDDKRREAWIKMAPGGAAVERLNHSEDAC